MHNSEMVLKEIDKHLAHLIVRQACRYFGCKKSVGWKVYKRLKIQSVVYQRKSIYKNRRSKYQVAKKINKKAA